MIKRIVLLAVGTVLFGVIQIFLTNIEWLKYLNVYMILMAVIYLRSWWRGEVYAVVLVASVGHALLQGYNAATYALPLMLVLLALAGWRNIYPSAQVLVENMVLLVALFLYSLLYVLIQGVALPDSLLSINFVPIMITSIVAWVIGYVLTKILFFVRPEYELKV